MRVGYERVYPSDPDPTVQRHTLEDAGCVSIHTDDTRETGAAQPQLAVAFDHLRPGDTLVVTSLDRLAHHSAVLVDHVARIEEIGAHLHIVDNGLDTREDPERVFFRTIAAVNDVTTVGRSQRVRRGIAAARGRGRRPGRPTIDQDSMVRAIQLLALERDEHGNRRHTISEIARETGVSRATVYRYIDLLDQSP